MKKNIIIIAFILIIVIESFLFIINHGKHVQTEHDMQVTIDSLNSKINYLNSKQITPEIKKINNLDESININNHLNLSLSNLEIDSSQNLINIDLNYSSNDNTGIQSVSYNLIVYDKNVNIIGNYLPLFPTEQLNQLFNDNSLEYTADKNLTKTQSHNIDSTDLTLYKANYSGTFNSSSSLDLSEVYLRLSDIKYSLYSGEEYSLVDTIYDIKLK